MTWKPRYNSQLDVDSLQADVMRFMAIIAFCLIAMLALVKNLEPSQETATGRTAAAAEPAPGPAPATSRTTPAAPTPAPASEPRQPAVAEIEAPVRATPQPQIATREPPPALPAEPPREPQEPLTFRFASDRAFLHLIAGDEVTLLASTAQGFVAMKRDFTLVPAQPAGELYEVKAASVPGQIHRVFEAAHRDPRYLVALPARTTAQLKTILARLDPQTAGGSLVIHRDGNITHEDG